MSPSGSALRGKKCAPLFLPQLAGMQTWWGALLGCDQHDGRNLGPNSVEPPHQAWRAGVQRPHERAMLSGLAESLLSQPVQLQYQSEFAKLVPRDHCRPHC